MSTLQVKKRSTNVGDNVYPTVEGRESEEWMVVDCGTLPVALLVHRGYMFFISYVWYVLFEHTVLVEPAYT